MILCLFNQGAGDHFICAGFAIAIAQRTGEETHVYSRRYPLETVRWLYRSSPVKVVGPEPPLEDNYTRIVRTGDFNRCEYDRNRFVEEFARHAGVPVDTSWENFPIIEPPPTPIEPPTTPFDFVHDLPEEGAAIERMNDSEVRPTWSEAHANLFEWLPVIRAAREIHCVDSAFANLVDRLPVEMAPGRLVFHPVRLRPPLPLRKNWEICQ